MKPNKQPTHQPQHLCQSVPSSLSLPLLLSRTRPFHAAMAHEPLAAAHVVPILLAHSTAGSTGSRHMQDLTRRPRTVRSHPEFRICLRTWCWSPAYHGAWLFDFAGNNLSIIFLITSVLCSYAFLGARIARFWWLIWELTSLCIDLSHILILCFGLWILFRACWWWAKRASSSCQTSQTKPDI